MSSRHYYCRRSERYRDVPCYGEGNCQCGSEMKLSPGWLERQAAAAKAHTDALPVGLRESHRKPRQG